MLWISHDMVMNSPVWYFFGAEILHTLWIETRFVDKWIASYQELGIMKNRPKPDRTLITNKNENFDFFALIDRKLL